MAGAALLPTRKDADGIPQTSFRVRACWGVLFGIYWPCNVGNHPGRSAVCTRAPANKSRRTVHLVAVEALVQLVLGLVEAEALLPGLGVGRGQERDLPLQHALRVAVADGACNVVHKAAGACRRLPDVLLQAEGRGPLTHEEREEHKPWDDVLDDEEEERRRSTHIRQSRVAQFSRKGKDKKAQKQKKKSVWKNKKASKKRRR